MLLNSTMDQDIRDWIKEDIPYWDLSTHPRIEDKTMKAIIIAKSKGMVSGVTVCSRVFEILGVETRTGCSDGDIVEINDVILEIEGRVSNILRAERVALNILSHLSGISNKVSELRGILDTHKLNTILAATRKTLPGLRKYQKYAIKVGGGDTHRLDLSSMAMIKENHIRAYGGISEAVSQIRKNISFSQKIEIEVTNDEEALEAVKADVDIIMFDNYSSEQIADIIPKLREIDSKVLTEASGNINEETFLDYARSGVDIISMGSLTHSSKVFDVSLLITNE